MKKNKLVLMLLMAAFMMIELHAEMQEKVKNRMAILQKEKERHQVL